MKKYFWLGLVLVLAALLRLYHNFDISLWHDEAFSVLMLRYPWREMFTRLGMDVHPPMYYIALRLWHYVFGDKLWSLRSFSVLFGVLTVWAIWLFVKEAFKNEKMALWAAFLAAVSPFAIAFSTEARMYTFGAFFAVLAAYFLVRALIEQKAYLEDGRLHMPNLPQDISLKKHFVWHYVWFGICTAVIILTHYYLLFTAAALGVYGLSYLIYHYGRNYKRYGYFFLSWIIIVIAFLPWLKTFLFQYRQVGAGYWIPPIDIWSIPGTLWTILLGLEHNNSNPLTQKILVLVLIFSLYFFWRFLRKTQSPAKWLVTLATLAPFGGAILFAILAFVKGSKSSVYEERYFLFGSVFYSIALAAWLSGIKFKKLSVSLFIIYCLFNLYAFAHYWRGLNIQNRPGMGAAAKFIGANATTGQQVFVGTVFEFFNYKYYATTYYPQSPVPKVFTGGRASVSQMSHVEGNSLLSDQDLAPDFTKATKVGDTVWLVWTYAFGSSRPSIPKNWKALDEKEFPDVRPYVGTSIYVTEYRVD